MFASRLIVSAIALFVSSLPLAARAQQYPPPPPQAGALPVPPQPPAESGPGPQVAPPVTAFHLRGVVIDAQSYFVTLDAGGDRVPVRLNDGTTVLPQGATLQSGMRIAVDGYWIRHNGAPPVFIANRVVLLDASHP